MKKSLELSIFERDGYTCRGCHSKFPSKYQIDTKRNRPGEPGFQNYLIVDHVEGRSEEPSNLQALCFNCNISKSGRGQNAFQLSIALKRLGRCVAYYPALARLMGLKESIFLCQLIYWTPKGRHEKGDGWIYKSVEEMDEETGLTYKEQIRIRKSLQRQKLLEEFYDREQHRLYFRVLADGLNKLSGHLPDGQVVGQVTNGQVLAGQVATDNRSGGTFPKVSSYKEQETTQESTQKNKAVDLYPFAEKIVDLWDRKESRDHGVEKTVAAIRAIAKATKGDPIAAARWLFRRVHHQAAIYRSKRELDKWPYIATWMHQKRYNDAALSGEGPVQINPGIARDGAAALDEKLRRSRAATA